MQKIKEFFACKGIGFYFSLACLLAVVVGLGCFCSLVNVSQEATEAPATVIGLAVVAMVLCLAAAVYDFKRIFSLAAFVLVSFMFFNFIGGRVSYLAYYFSGDILGTGLSPYFIVSAIFFVISLICAICAVCFKQKN